MATEDISLLAWTMIIGEALRREDADGLFAFDIALMKMRHPLEESAKALKDVADDLFVRANALKNEMLKQLVQILMPNLSGTADNAMAFALHRSLELLHSAVLEAARNYATASETLTYWADQLKQLEDYAEDAGWHVARKRAALKLQIEQAKQFRSEASVEETKEEKQKREFMEALTRPNALAK